ncbi:transcriptional regulator [Flagellimonas aquimarina]|uniref:Transcriptional regulator n=1 Tax=Flagellimonas aquimarina TaxID=2201895 RepID=A0A316KX18_9FLAO|nr:response regulator [Allomuricauda koreensis]PWL37648.1 transcriptional regulator [Allomuricauda koreensis]
MKKILLVEDDLSLRENIAELLDLSGFLVFDAPNGEIAIEIAKKECPDLILCDIMMPGVDGYGVLEALSANEDTRHIPFIFVSAKTERLDIRRGMDLGADDYLTKPFEEEELLGAIHARLAKAKLIDSAFSARFEASKNKNQMRSLNELKNFFDDHGELCTFKKEEVIYSEGDHSNNIYLILKGVVKCYKLDEQGKELITALYAADEFLGFTSLMDNIPHQEYAVAIEGVELANISKSRLKTILEENQQVSMELMELMAGNILQIKEQLLQMAYSSVRKKTAQTLLQFAKAMNKRSEEPLQITRGDLANVAGIATESLIRTLSDFKSEGLIAVENRKIMILDRESLQCIN